MDGLISSNGIVLQGIQDDQLFVDGTALYVDNLIDCFKTWNMKGSLHQHCVEQYSKEVELMSCIPNMEHPVVESMRKMWEQLEIQIITESEHALLGVYLAWRKNPKTAAESLLTELRLGEKRIETDLKAK